MRLAQWLLHVRRMHGWHINCRLGKKISMISLKQPTQSGSFKCGYAVPAPLSYVLWCHAFWWFPAERKGEKKKSLKKSQQVNKKHTLKPLHVSTFPWCIHTRKYLSHRHNHRHCSSTQVHHFHPTDIIGSINVTSTSDFFPLRSKKSE